MDFGRRIVLATSPQETLPFGISLVLAEKWANEAGKKTQRAMSDPLPDGSKLPLLIVTHGSYKVLVREQGSCLVVFARVEVSDVIAKKIAPLAPEDKQRLLIALRGELSSNTRTGYSYIPEKFTSVDQLEAFNVQQLLKISENDTSSFNRFCDAIQEVVTIAVRAIALFGLFALSQSTSTADVRPAPASLYR